ncbi:hypothetical protein MASR1M59_27060 [Melaminivora sp.]
MIYVKTPAGQQALRERHGAAAHLAPRQRSAFILFDGKRSLQEVLAATAGLGISLQDVQAMIDQGLLAPPGQDAGQGQTEDAVVPSPAAAVPRPASGRSDLERYQAAYPIAIELTATLGLRGFRLNLAVEGTTGYQQLAELAPKIHEAVGDTKYARLSGALFD